MRTIRYIVVIVFASTTLWLSSCTSKKMAAISTSVEAPSAPSAPADKIKVAAPATSAPREESHEHSPIITVPADKAQSTSRQSHSAIKATLPPSPSSPPSNEINSYLVKVEANKKMEVSIDPEKPASGLLRVWIGQPPYEPKTPAGMTAASSVLQTGAPAASAKVTPIVLNDPAAFKIEPITETRCQVIAPTGTEVPFSITPIKTGEFSVGASVELYENRGCEGDASTQTAEPTTVEVTVQLPPPVTFLEIAWAAIKNFIKEILAVLFAMVILVFRKRLFKLFGIEGDKQ